MSDSTLWAIALGVGVLGLLLVVVAGVAAVSANARARRSREAPPTPELPSQSQGPSEVRESGGGWLWMKAGVFAFIHAGAVSFVLGGLTFFEDIARANEEIRTTGMVTFPKRLLPKTLVGPDSSLPFAQAMDGLGGRSGQPVNASNQVTASSASAVSREAEDADWEVVEVVPEAALE